MAEKNILFITHDASRTGAPILLLNFINWMKNNHPEYNIYTLISSSGELIPEFQKISKEAFFPYKYFNFKLNELNTLVQKRNTRKVLKKINSMKWDFIFSNTIVNGKVLENINTLNIPVFSYIHELEYTIDFYDQTNQVEGTIKKTDFFICGSQTVQRCLIQKFGKVNAQNSSVVNSFADIQNNIIDFSIKKNLKQQLNIPEDSFVVGMVGAFSWRKGEDIFTEVAFLNNEENIHFVWIGINNEARLNQIKTDIDRVNKTVNLHLMPPSADYLRYYHMFDCFFLSSREDPYPLVMLEATSFGLPVIYFNNSGGAHEFLKDNYSFEIEFYDLQQVLQTIHYLKNNKKEIQENSQQLRENTINIHQTEKGAEKLFNLIITQL